MTTPPTLAPTLREHFQAYWGAVLGAFLWAAHALAAARRATSEETP